MVSSVLSVTNSFEDKSHSRIKQIMPLQLAFALTIHKCQGLTLKHVTTDCCKSFAPGQLSVALGRVQDISDVTLRNFDSSIIKAQPQHVMEFLEFDGKA